MKLFLLAALLLLISSFLVYSTNATYFYMAVNRDYCFYEDLNANAKVLLVYKIHPMDPMAKKYYKESNSQSVDIDVLVRDPIGNIIKHEKLSHKEGGASFTSSSQLAGLYEFCVKYNSPYEGSDSFVQIQLTPEVDDDANEYGKIESKDRVERISAQLDKLKDKLFYVTDEQIYFKNREERFRQTTDSNSTRIFWMGLVQIATFLFIGYVQVWNLKGFMVRKKLV